MKKFIIGNLKMNFTEEETKKYLNTLIPLVEEANNKIAICFPFTNIPLARKMLKGTKILLGAQNVHEKDSGEFTGEISANMLKDLSCELVLVGHSERRKYFGESNQSVNAKIKQLLKNGLGVIFCIGESLAERESDKTKIVLKQQIEQGLSGLYENELNNIVIAYEPIWAIGTGKIPTKEQIEEVAKFIREVITQNFSEKAAKEVAILYGGSVKPENVKIVLKAEGVNGGLIGGASLNPESFSKIIRVK